MKILFLHHNERLGPRLTDERWSLSKENTVKVLFWHRNGFHGTDDENDESAGKL